MKQTGIVFDFDGTLIDSTTDIRDAVNVVLEEHERPSVSADAVRDGIGHGARELLEYLLDDVPDDPVVDTMLEDFRSAYQSMCTNNIIPYPSIPELLGELNGTPTAIVTNKPYSMTRAILESIAWNNHFDPVYGADSHDLMKPSPQPLHAVAEAWNNRAETHVMIGDNWTDIVAGQKAGFVTIGCEYGLGSTADLREAEPDYIVESPGELSDIIETIRNGSD